jgi:peptidoglycan L-alanyl-D-glutamate endopeptidase CwlK
MGFVAADQREADILAKLYPKFRVRVQQTLQQCRAAGLAVYIFEGMRTVERQAELYAKGRDANGVVVNKKLVVTNAKPGSSFHNYGLAADLVFDGDTAKPGIQWSWAKPTGDWMKMGKIAQAANLDWAGSWRSFPEMPHVQMPTPGLGWRDFLKIYQAAGLSAVWFKIDSLT